MSPAWFPWIGTAPTLELLLEIGIDAIHEHNLRLANRFRAGLSLPPGDSAIVSAELPEAEERLQGTRVMAAARAGLLRTSWHVYNTDEDVDELLALLTASTKGSDSASGGPCASLDADRVRASARGERTSREAATGLRGDAARAARRATS